MTPALYYKVFERLIEAEGLSAEAVELVDAACKGDDDLREALAALGGGEVTKPKQPAGKKQQPPGAYLEELEVGGFRGIGAPQKLTLRPGPGLTVILGRNGSGKSSFSEGLEALLTGDSSRWSARPKDWKEGWRNLHHSGAPFVEARFVVEGSEPIVARRSWKDGVEDGELRVRRGSERLEGELDALGWREPLTTYRPFLSYSELGRVLEQPSQLYDPLKAILGLDEVSQAVKRLNGARKARDQRKKAEKDSRKDVLALLETVDGDERATICKEALGGRKPKLDAVEAVVLGTGEGDEGVVASLKRIAQLTPPSLDAVSDAVTKLREAIAAQADLADGMAKQAAGLAGLLEKALTHVEAYDGPCPVCEAPLDDAWAAKTRDRLEAARTQSTQVAEARKALAEAGSAARALVRPVPDALRSCEQHALPTSLLTLWERWAQLPDAPDALADHLEQLALELSTAVPELCASAQKKLDALVSAWNPVARKLAAYLEQARRVEAEAATLTALKDAEKWLQSTESSLRDERFQPIAADAQRIWAMLRQDSNVDLTGVRLDGRGTRRRVALDVSVDGTEGVALGVMSQGELNALALSLFLPRMTLGGSPFHFVIVDDPVQAMDPHKVDGLAQVFAEVAKQRQVVVLTHDNRLYNAIRRQGIEASVLEVQRGQQSTVHIRPLLDPVKRHLKDARTLMYEQDQVGPDTAKRVVPTFCRLALEAACTEAYRRRALQRGDRHVDVEDALRDAQGLHKLLALRLEQSPDQVYGYINQRYGHASTTLVKNLKEAAHKRYPGDLRDLIELTNTLAMELRAP